MSEEVKVETQQEVKALKKSYITYFVEFLLREVEKYANSSVNSSRLNFYLFSLTAAATSPAVCPTTHSVIKCIVSHFINKAHCLR